MVPTPVVSSGALPGFALRFWPVWTAGVVGVLSLATSPPPAALLEAMPQLSTLSPLMRRVTLMVNPFFLMTVLALIGAAVAHRAGLYSLLAGTAQHPASWWVWVRWPLAVGSVLAAVLATLDAAIAPHLGPAWQAVQAQADQAPRLTGLLQSLLYGGLTEEIMLRWGVMAFIAWAGVAVHARWRGPPGHTQALPLLLSSSPGWPLR